MSGRTTVPPSRGQSVIIALAGNDLRNDPVAVRKPEIRRHFAYLGAIPARPLLNHFLDAIRDTPPDFQDVDLFPLIEEVIRLLDEPLLTNKIEVNVKVEAPTPIILAEMNQFKQVFYNIFKNSMEAMPRGGVIKIKLRSDDEFVYIMIADTGIGIDIGIDQEDLSKIFQPYFTTKDGGHGLGIMVINRIMRAQGAKIGIDNRKNKGTVVTLQFPQKYQRVRLLKEPRA